MPNYTGKGWFQKGHKPYISDEISKKISDALKGRVSPMKGRKHSEKSKKQTSGALKKAWKRQPWNIGVKKSEETKRKMSENNACYWLNKKRSEETKKKISFAHLAKNGGIPKKRQMRNDSAYQSWVKQVKKRDKQCQLKNESCEGYLIVHHILGWSEYPNLRYELTNGITLCQAHHPRKRIEEKRLVSIFQKIVSVHS